MLNETRRKFCEGIVRGLTATEAYHEAYPRASHLSAQNRAHRLMQLDAVKLEIRHMRAAADPMPDSAVLDCAKKRRFLARVVRASLAALDPVLDGDLLQICENFGKCTTSGAFRRLLPMTISWLPGSLPTSPAGEHS